MGTASSNADSVIQEMRPCVELIFQPLTIGGGKNNQKRNLTHRPQLSKQFKNMFQYTLTIHYQYYLSLTQNIFFKKILFIYFMSMSTL